MKKCNFYSMVRENGAAIAKPHTGYTDGGFNYYRRENIWFAIHPANGLSICTGSTRKAAAEQANAPAMLERVAAALEWATVTKETFAAAVKKAEGEAS